MSYPGQTYQQNQPMGQAIQPGYAQPHMGGQQYPGQPSYGNPGYNQPGYGQPGMQQPMMGNPGYNQPMGNSLKNCTGPVNRTCPQCKQTNPTVVKGDISGIQWLVCCLIFWVLCWYGIGWFICCIPCCIPDCYQYNHNCPNCNHYYGNNLGM